MSPTPTEDQKLCCECITAPDFMKIIESRGQTGKCDFDTFHEPGPVMTVEAFAEHVDVFFREHYQLGEDAPYFVDGSDNVQHGQAGSDLADILANELQADTDDVVQAIIEFLPDVSQRDVMQGAEPFYDDTANYESIEDVSKREIERSEEYWFENRFHYQWEEFCNLVQYESRYFKAKEALDGLFGKPETYLTGKINPIYTFKAGGIIFRARLLEHSLTKDKLRARPAMELGAPPRERTSAGRMNVEFIPAFYAAFSELTAVAEIRPSIEEQVAIGRFSLARDIRVFDFTAFSEVTGENWKEVVSHTRYDFIDQMVDEISRPLIASERQRHYISTQIVAEYLKEYFDCDAVIYRSAAVGQSERAAKNIVLLPRGTEFVAGDTPLLGFEGYEIKTVTSIQYQLEAPLF